MTDYKQAKEIAKTLELHGEITVNAQKIETFRKYLRDFSHGKGFVTKVVDGKLRINRIS